MRQLQQGDVLLAQTKLPEGAKRVQPQGGTYVLVEGETTGHAHRVEAVPEVELYEHDGTLYLRVKDSADITHEEHNTVSVPRGTWEVGRVVEYDYDAEERRYVAD